VTLDTDDIQGLLARGYGGLKHARFTLFAAAGAEAARALLAALTPRVTTAGEFSGDTALHLALTPVGLRRLGLPQAHLERFAPEFVAGMTDQNRSRFLGDVEESSPHGWAWGGPQSPPVDGLVLLYAVDAATLDRAQAELRRQCDEIGLRVVRELRTLELRDTEAFGFRDGISQPLVEGLDKGGTAGRAVAAGEFVLGYPNGYRLLTDRPLLPASDDPHRLLPRDPGGSGAADLGRNGSYLVVRQLAQDVAAFRGFLADATRRPDGSADPQAEVALAAKMVGRWPSGAPLVTSPDRDDPAKAGDNDFGYHDLDPLGRACPLGAHVRRVNPRDSLDPRPGSDASLDVNDRHRLLRRGRSYGPNGGPGQNGVAQDGDSGYDEAGLYFMCLAGNLARQYEFVQHTWVNNPTFNGLYDDTDPLVGSRRPAGDPSGGTFTAPAHPVRRRYRNLPQFVRTRGGAYFFLPGVSALRYLAQLPLPSATR
jgi:Dyp-type peroxidase family